MGTATLSFLARYPVPPEILWQVVTDHEGMSRWAGVPVSIIAAPPDRGVGTVRRVKVGPLRLDEEVVALDPPRRMIYRMTRGLPLRYHRGEVRVAPFGEDGSELTWEITLVSDVPFFVDATARVLRRSINRALRKLGEVLTEG